MAEQLEGIARAASYGGVGTPRTFGLSEFGGLHTDSLLPRYAELCRLGKIYHTKHTVATAIAPVQTVPTTTAAMVINNVDTGASAKNLVMLDCGIYLGSGTSDIGATVMAGVTGGPLATQLTADGTGTTRGQGLGAGQATSVAWVDYSKTVVASWCVVGGFDANPAAAVPGSCRVFDLDGKFIVRPTYAFMMHVLAGAGTTAKYCFSATWLEIPITVSI